MRGTEGFFRVAQDHAGRWTLLDPERRPFFCKAVHGVRAAEPAGDGALVPDSVARLRRWGFNALGAGAYPEARDDGAAFVGVVGFVDAAPAIVADGVRLPDVFDPGWPALAARCAREVCAAQAEERQLLGWAVDDGVEWAQPELARATGARQAARPSLLQICLSLEPGFAAYHAAWEFVLALHGGRFEALARAWGAALPNKEAVRVLTRAEEGLGTRGYLRDEARWTREFARRYFATAGAAIRAADPNHLILGSRSREPAGPGVLAESMYPAVDVALVHWSEVAAVDAAPLSPVLASDVGWTDETFPRAAAGGKSRRPTTVEWMLRRARAALERLARNPAVVGYAWGRWQDEPGEQPPFGRGLVHVNGAEAREHTELLAQFNARAEAIRRASRPESFQS